MIILYMYFALYDKMFFFSLLTFAPENVLNANNNFVNIFSVNCRFV